MKFLMIDHDIIERGGINRIVEGLQYGLEAAGCQVHYYWASRGGKLRGLSETAPTMMGERYYRLPARQLSYGRRDSHRLYTRLLRQYDAVIMMNPCPHDIKGKFGDMSWMMLYEAAAEAGKPIITIIHDNLWDKYYEWYRQVSDLVKFHLFTCYQSKYDSLSRLPGHFVFLPTPLDVRSVGLFPDEKTGALCWMPQWKKWKGIYQFLDALPKIQVPVNLYNSGIEYHNVRQDSSGMWKAAIGLNHVNKTRGRGNPDHQYWGAQLPDAIPGIYQRHFGSIDLSGSIGDRFDGQTSCVMLEAMMYGCVSIVHEKVDQHPWSPIARQDIVWTVPSDPQGIADRVNELSRLPKRRARIASRALEFVRAYSDARRAAYMILDFLDADLVNDPEHPAVFYDDVCEDPVPIHDYTVYERVPYVSKHAPREEEEETIVEAEELAETVEMDLAPVVEMMTNGHSPDGRWMNFISDVARAWLRNFG